VLRSVHRIAGRTRATMLVAALLSGATLPAVGLGEDSAAALPNPNCITVIGLTTCTFHYTGTALSWPVPAGITQLTVVADGASGASAVSTFFTGGGTGGKGGEYRATLTRIPSGTTLSVFPGGMGTGITGGRNVGPGSGGRSSTDTVINSDSGGGGGGATTIALSPFSVGNVLVAAGGGGGAGAENQTPDDPANGGNGGGSGHVNGVAGFPATASGRGFGGTPTTGGGNGGNSGCTDPAFDGAQLNGGNSNSVACTFVGGGGGSGYFGGGGSSISAGAGGGSAFPATLTTVHGIHIFPDTTDHAANSGNGRVMISYRRVPTHITPDIFFNFRQTFTVAGTLDSLGRPVAGRSLSFSTGFTRLCTAITNSHGVASCVLSYAKSIAIRQNAGHFTVFFPGTAGYLPSIASGQAIISP
jgi:Glycine rich protein